MSELHEWEIKVGAVLANTARARRISHAKKFPTRFFLHKPSIYSSITHLMQILQHVLVLFGFLCASRRAYHSNGFTLFAIGAIRVHEEAR